ncbi:MAG: FAD-binding oxidoreductase [Synechococcaceae cyanobacterium]
MPQIVPKPASADQLEALAKALVASGLEPIRQPEDLKRLSQDRHDFSPLLTPLLSGCRAQLAVRVTSVDQVRQVAAACFQAKVPLTVRGAGSGNYGQCVPLVGGLVVDLGGLRLLRQLEADSQALWGEAGALLADIDAELLPRGRALRLAPSTWRSATVGGFIAGGSGGIGSLRWGFLRDPGNLLGLEVVTIEAEPRLLRLDAQASEPLNHAYGCNGIVTALRLPSCEAVAWQQLVVGFSAWDQSLAAAQALPTTALQLNSLCLLEAPIAARSPWPAGCPGAEAGEHRLLVLAAPDTLEVLPGWLARRGGELRWQAPQGQSRGLPLRELTWNHTTLHWRAHSPDWTYLQLLLPQPEGPALASLRARWGKDLLWHLEAVRHQGAARLACLPLLRWRGEADLRALLDHCGSLGAQVFNPHVLTVEDGGLGVVDGDQVAAKAAYDPAGLLNPGKLRGWLERQG